MNPVGDKDSQKIQLCPGCLMKNKRYVLEVSLGKEPLVEDCGDSPGCATCPRTISRLLTKTE